MKIAIDGPAGAGKSTIARLLARRLGIIYIDTGAMYRTLTLKALRQGIDLNNENELYQLILHTDIDFFYNGEEQKVLCDGEDVTEDIRKPEITAHVSRVASFPRVRKIMVERQKRMADKVSVVMDGRDIGECVLPDADYKFFLTASIEERAERRRRELIAQGYDIDLDRLKEEIKKRDEADASREVGALKILEDSIVIDTSHMSIEEVVDNMMKIIGEK
ncbi:cytidylate kinase [Thermosyntropha lipolytica DSM 11003]|uniref:Cytidylate kinase n=1 Tax=Thermosyntropha lipolytica DSM 11003 TaxID=1123382 RepID=A0A1M5QBC7_9FIRM|nr:(d)CMP kinase [Thermosyntropha lipolytica]SHH10803.1 cytidylate kinase [Thermosyntropha lipolytica DSM 11003]